MQSSSVVKLPQTDLPEQPILIHVTKKTSNDLDVDLLATDGNSIYRGKLRERSYTKFRSANYDGTDKQWASILNYIFISKTSSGIDETDRQNLDVTCTLNADPAKLTITFVTRIEDIVHRLGTIELAHSEDESGADLFEWNCQVIDQRDQHEQQLIARVAETKAAQEAVAALRKQLEDMITAKEEHESQLLAKFTLLLDEKKLKIRNQQRLLKTAKVDSKKLAAMQRSIPKQQEGNSLYKRKREATDESRDEGASHDRILDDGSDEEMEDADSLDERQTTDTATDSGDDQEEVLSPPSASNSKTPAIGELTPPPSRPLPFQKKGLDGPKSSAADSKPIELDDEETASEDDEL